MFFYIDKYKKYLPRHRTPNKDVVFVILIKKTYFCNIELISQVVSKSDY